MPFGNRDGRFSIVSLLLNFKILKGSLRRAPGRNRPRHVPPSDCHQQSMAHFDRFKQPIRSLPRNPNEK